MKLFEELVLKYKYPDWSRNPEFGLIDVILEKNSDIILLMRDDIVGKSPSNQFGRGDTPSVEQIVRAAIFKEMRNLDYRGLEYAQHDSRICEHFIKIDDRKPYSFQMYQKYISRIQPATLQQVLYRVNKLAIEEGYENVSQMVQDTTVVKSNIHYPTNNSLVWDCIRDSHRLLTQLKKEVNTLSFIDYTKAAKKTHFKINVTKVKDKRYDLFCKQLILFTKVINQTSNLVKKKYTSLAADQIQIELKDLLTVMLQVYDVALRHEIDQERVPNQDKVFSIYERHTDIIVKGQRDVEFGHKVSLATGSSNLILDCQILKGNPADSGLYQGVVNRIIEGYGIVPRDCAADGGYASLNNLNWAKDNGIKNIVFNKVVGSLQNQVSSKNMETRLKKWRSSIEANISNLKRGFHLRVCTWKGWAHFQSKVLWSVLAYNFRVITKLVMNELSVAKATG